MEEVSLEDFPYGRADLENIPCNLCESRDFKVLEKDDRNNIKVKTVICKRCGLIFLNPRMTREWYQKYYQFEYRRQVESYGSKESASLDDLFDLSRKHGRFLGSLLKDYLVPRSLTVEAGSSVGGILKGLAPFLKGEVIGIEPSVAEAEYAIKNGVPTLPIFFEDIDSNYKNKLEDIANIFCVQTLNHLQNPRSFFEWAYNALAENGRLVLEVKNFRHHAKKVGRLRQAIQVDHTYMFLPETLENFINSSGFKIIFRDVDEYKSRRQLEKQGKPNSHMRFVAVKSKKDKVEIYPDYKKIKRTINPLKIYLNCLVNYRLPRKLRIS